MKGRGVGGCDMERKTKMDGGGINILNRCTISSEQSESRRVLTTGDLMKWAWPWDIKQGFQFVY